MKKKEHRLKVSELHELQVYEYGEKGGIPIVFLHGGPGSGIVDSHYSIFDPKIHHVILFDQRGCGKSTPYLSLEENTTWNLVDDIEKLRKFFNFSSWYVVGGSWGSTLGYTYLAEHPEAVRGAVIWASTELSREDNHEMLRVFPVFYPEHWEEYLKAKGTPHCEDLINFEHKEMISGDPTRIQKSLDRALPLWACGLSLDEKFKFKGMSHNAVTLFFYHYCKNQAFFNESNRPTRRNYQLKGKPVHILHGRQDMRCFANVAYRMHKTIEGSRYEIIPGASHGLMDTNISAAVLQAVSEVCR